MLALLLLQLATWERVSPPVQHQGTWQSCDSEERVLEHRLNGRLLYELHMGPDDEFALYDHKVDGDADDHDSPANLLGPAYRVSMLPTFRGARQWTVPRLHLWISVVRAGGSRDECQSFFIRIEAK